ncbi:hypothetical protein C8R47DRAFT_1082449 [Mycena vitilis]|nr:hypothetical protein C8R47DRAFT_1082449 [Mycena vitilis]
MSVLPVTNTNWPASFTPGVALVTGVNGANSLDAWAEYSLIRRSEILTSFPFGRDRYSFRELRPYVPEAFRYLRRGYFNVVRRQLKERIATMQGLAELQQLYSEWTYLGYGPHAVQWIVRRLATLHGFDAVVVLPRSHVFFKDF